MGSHAYIQREDLGLSVLGTPQYAYSVDGVHGQDYCAAVFQASLCRVTALEDTISAFAELLDGRQKKVDELSSALASIASALGTKDDEKDLDDSVEIGEEAAEILRRYGFDTQSKTTYRKLMELQPDVQYAIDAENNDLQQDMSAIQNYVTKRDDAMGYVSKFQDKISETRKKGIQNIGS